MIERKQLRESLKGIQDVERLTSRIFLGHANARDLIGLKNSLQSLPVLKAFSSPSMPRSSKSSHPKSRISMTFINFWNPPSWIDPPLTIKEGGIIKPKYDKELDELREIGREGKGWILRLEAEERKKTGISSLKVRYNQVFGYYIEVTKSHLHLVPDHYIEKTDSGQCRTVYHPGAQRI